MAGLYEENNFLTCTLEGNLNVPIEFLMCISFDLAIPLLRIHLTENLSGQKQV